MAASPAPGSTAIGIDVGGTKVAAVVVDERGRSVGDHHRAHDGTGAGALGAAAQLVSELAGAYPRTVGVGFAVAGLVDRSKDMLVHGALLGLRGSRLGELIAERTHLPVLVENDANATLAGVLAGSALGESDVTLLVALGTGVGGAVAVGGRLLPGTRGFAGELGHVPVVGAAASPCPCGGRGCLELVASGTAVARIAAERGITVPGRDATGRDVVDAAGRGDTVALAVLAEAGEAVADVLVGLTSVLDPSTVYLSGGFGHAAGPFLIPALRTRLRERLPFSDVRTPPVVRPDPIGPLAAAYGAAVLALRHVPTPSERHTP